MGLAARAASSPADEICGAVGGASGLLRLQIWPPLSPSAVLRAPPRRIWTGSTWFSGAWSWLRCWWCGALTGRNPWRRRPWTLIPFLKAPFRSFAPPSPSPSISGENPNFVGRRWCSWHCLLHEVVALDAFWTVGTAAWWLSGGGDSVAPVAEPAASLLLPPWTPCCCLTDIFLLSKGSSVGSGDAVFLVKFLSHVGCALFLLLLVASFRPCSRVSNPICRRFGAFRARRGGRGLLRQWEWMKMLFQGLGCLVPS